MKKHIYQDGPISCGIQATPNLENNYTGGVYKEYIQLPQLNHEIAVVGWGVDKDSGEEFWKVRNSWGTYWGINGFMKLSTNILYDLGINMDCSYGIPGDVTWINPNDEPSKQSFI